MVHVPVPGSKESVPAGVGLPMSAQLHMEGQGTGGSGAGAEVPTTTVSTMAELSWVLSPDVTASPPKGLDPRFTLAPEPGTGLHV